MDDAQQKIKDSTNQLFKNNNINNFIFIYTPPKVGSTTLVSSLRVSLGKTFNIIHIHDEIMLSVLTGINGVLINDIINYLASINKTVYVIDVYRTPIERKMSEFFEKISPYHFNNSEENINNYPIKFIEDRFNKLFPYLENGDHYLDKYNILNPQPFDFEKKYTIQEINNIFYVKLRLCDTHLWANILSTILQAEIILITDYKTETKKIGDLYTKFKAEYKLPSNYFENIKQCKYFNFYFSEEERNNYLNNWQTKLCKEFISYTENEYKFYMNLCLENQFINDIQVEHYIDNGCFCKFCTKKRREIFFKAKNGEQKFEKIIHSEVIFAEKQFKKKQIVEIVCKKKTQKFLPRQFSIHF
jgi:hypothetical protein